MIPDAGRFYLVAGDGSTSTSTGVGQARPAARGAAATRRSNTRCLPRLRPATLGFTHPTTALGHILLAKAV